MHHEIAFESRITAQELDAKTEVPIVGWLARGAWKMTSKKIPTRQGVEMEYSALQTRGSISLRHILAVSKTLMTSSAFLLVQSAAEATI